MSDSSHNNPFNGHAEHLAKNSLTIHLHCGLQSEQTSRVCQHARFYFAHTPTVIGVMSSVLNGAESVWFSSLRVQWSSQFLPSIQGRGLVRIDFVIVE